MKLNFFRLRMVALTLMVGWAASPVEAARITPQYDTKPENQKYWTANFKNQVNVACGFLADYINDNQTITITITIDSAMSGSTFAYANMAKVVGSTNTADKFIAQSGEVAFNPAFYDEAAKDWKGNNISLMGHEILHCLGFSNTINAFKKYISSTGTFTGPKTSQLNNGVAPSLADDKSHFRRVTKDPAGVVPRMMEGGGQILSILDLSVLADISYNIPAVNSATTATCLGFQLSPVNFGKYNQSQYNATTFVRGGCGNDTLTAKGATESLILFGGDGEDGLLDETTSPVVMVGDDLDAFRSGKDNSDTYIIRHPGTKVIVGLGDKDKIWIPYAFGSFANRTYEMPDNTYPTYMNGDNPYAAFKVKFPPVTLYVYFEVKNGDWQGTLEKVKQQIEKCVVRVSQ